MHSAAPFDQTVEATLNLGEIANVRRGEKVQVRPEKVYAEDAFQRTLTLLSLERSDVVRERSKQLSSAEAARDEYVPDNAQLRTVFLFAEAVGGYEKLHDLVYAYSPGLNLIEVVRETVAQTPLRPLQLRDLTAYRMQILEAMASAQAYLQDHGTTDFSNDDVRQLYELLTEAQSRAIQIDKILGQNLMHELNAAVVLLHTYAEKMRSVEETLSGVFLVESEVMFIPPNELIRCVDAIFRGVANPYLAANVDGVTLLAARNLLIQVVAFYSYYGKTQIYKMLNRAGATQGTFGITTYVRREIRQIFEACQVKNRLVLRRVMQDAAQEFELSVSAIQRAAEETAVENVRRMMPSIATQPKLRIRSWWRRLLGLR